MKHCVPSLVPLAMATLLTGCAKSPAEEPQEASETGEPCDPCTLTDDHNYNYTPTLTANRVSVPAREDVLVTWANLSVDLLGHDLDPYELDQIALLVGRDLTPEAMLEALALDRLDMSDLRIMLLCTPTDAACLLSDFGLGGSSLDPEEYFEEDSGTWLIAPGQSSQAGVASLVFLVPEEGAKPVDQVDMSDSPATLEVEVDLTGQVPLYVATGTLPQVHWSGLTMDALGNTIDEYRFDQLRLGQYELPIEDLEIQFLDLEELAVQTWEHDITGLTELDLSSLADAPQMDSESNWLLVLECSTCPNPAPRFLTVLTSVDP